MDENPQIIDDLPHFDSGDYCVPPKWHKGLTYIVGKIIDKDGEVAAEVTSDEIPE